MKIFVFLGNIHVSWILSAFHGRINVPLILSTFRGYLHSVDIIHVSWILSAFKDNIDIGHITSYLALNVCYFLHSFVLVADIIFDHITIYVNIILSENHP